MFMRTHILHTQHAYTHTDDSERKTKLCVRRSSGLASSLDPHRASIASLDPHRASIVSSMLNRHKIWLSFPLCSLFHNTEEVGLMLVIFFVGKAQFWVRS